MKEGSGDIVAIGDASIDDGQTTGVPRSATRPTWFAEAASLLTMVAIRAAQNYATSCFDDWIAPRRVARAGKTGSQQRPSCDGFATPIGEASELVKTDTLCEPAQARGNAVEMRVHENV